MYLPIIKYDFSDNQRGNAKDLKILDNSLWFHNTEVNYIIEQKSGRWHLRMIYIWIENPLRFFCNYIDNYESLEKATNYAQIFQRSISKDARGTLKTNKNAYNICFN